MLVVISPAKTLDYESPLATKQFTQPEFTADAQGLIDQLREFAPQDIADLMHLSDKLSALNVARYQSWSQAHDVDNARQAVLAFKGDVYTGLNAEEFEEADFEFAQNHLRILSGLYALLKPLDLMQPYRLEMGTKLKNAKGANLYHYWGSTITERLNSELQSDETPVLINLASNEYFKSVQPKNLNARVINPEFKDLKNGHYKIISFYAKKARGLMTRYIIKNLINNPEQLKDFDYEGYAYNESLSSGDNWVFTRDHAE